MEWANGEHTGNRTSAPPRDVRRAKGPPKISIQTHASTSETGRWKYKEHGKWKDYNAACQRTINKMSKTGKKQFILRINDGKCLDYARLTVAEHEVAVIVLMNLDKKEQRSMTSNTVYTIRC